MLGDAQELARAAAPSANLDGKDSLWKGAAGDRAAAPRVLVPAKIHVE